MTVTTYNLVAYNLYESIALKTLRNVDGNAPLAGSRCRKASSASRIPELLVPTNTPMRCAP